MDYRFDPSAGKLGAAPALTAAAAAQLQVQVPFVLRATLSVSGQGGPYPFSILSAPKPDQRKKFARLIRTNVLSARSRAR